MNRVYRLLWNEATGAWMVASEIARSRGKRGSTALLVTATLAMLLSPALGARTLPSGGSVSRGQAAISRSGSHMQVTQASKNAILNWSDFSVGRGASVHFNNGSGATLNRVTGALPSSIDGKLSATGSLYLVNRNGVIVGPNGVINAAGFTATTLDIRDDEFMAGAVLRFFGDSRAGVVNLGSIHADSGNVALVAHSVQNDGAISAPKGAAELLAGQDVFLASPDAPALLVSLEEGTASTGGTGVTNNGLIEAAQARMQAANGNLYALAINQSGVIRATGVSTREGRIVLTADGGTVQQNGKLSAQNANGSGGDILVGGDYQGRNASVANATRTIVTQNADMDASATAAQGDGGRVIVWANGDTRFAGSIKARGGEKGGNGGFVEVSGKNTLDFRPSQPLDLSAKGGKAGTVLLDPDEIDVVATAGGPNQIAVSDIEAGLASANYVLNTSSFDPNSGAGNITISDDLNWTSANTLTVRSGNAININANITGSNGALELYAAPYAEPPDETDLPWVDGGATLDAGKTIRVDTLRYGVNADSLPAGYTLDGESSTGTFYADGTLRANTLELDLAGGSTGLIAENTQNAIGAFRTTGSGDLGYVSVVDGEGDLRVRLNSTDSTSNGVYIVTPGNLTLEAGSRLSLVKNENFVSDVVLASTGGNFINEAGSNVFGENLRYLIYSGTRAGTDKGGLTGTEEYSRTYTGNPPDDYSSDNISRFLFAQSAARPELTYRADDLTRFYGDANPALTYSVSGLLAGDILRNVVSGDPLLSTSATLRSGVGAYTINISQGTLGSSFYDFLFAPGTLTINPAPLTLDIANISRYYGAANPMLTASVTGLKADDTAEDVLAGWMLSTDATRASDIGDYRIDANWLGTGTANYTYTVNPGTLAINPTPVTLTLAPTARTYGDVNPDFGALAMLTGAYNGDTVGTAFPTSIFSTSATQGSAVGTYAVDARGFNNPNYVLTIGDLGALTIGKATLVVNANNASRLYGDANPAFSVASINGWRNGDTLASIPGLVLTSGATGSSNVGNYAIVPSGIAINYEFAAGTGTLTINKAPVDVYLNAASRYYGDNDPLFSASYEGLRNSETSLPGLNPISNSDIYSQVGNYVISAGGTTTFQNYLPTFYAGVLTIAPRPLTVAGNTATRTYGYENPALSVAVSNATPWDAAQAAVYWIAGTEAGQRSDAGSYAVTPMVSPYGERFDNLSNYAVTYQPGTLNVLRAPLTVVAQPLSIIWGDGRPPLQYSVSGYMPWDSAETVGRVLLTSQAGGTNVAPGFYPITAADSNVGSNYRAELLGSPTVQVLPRPIVIVGNYAVPLAQIQQINVGQLEPFTVKRYDSNGNELSYQATSALAGGPQFSVMASSDGTRGDGLGMYVGKPFIQPAAGYSMDDVLRYYDPVSQPGTALATTLTTNENVLNRDFTPSQPETLEVDKPGTITLKPTIPPGETPPLADLVKDAFPDNGELLSEVRSLFDLAGQYLPGGNNSGEVSAARQVLDGMPREFQEYLKAVMDNESAYNWYQQTIADTESWIADLSSTRPRPANYDALVANAQADIARWRTEIDAMPSLENLQEKMLSGDTQTLQAMMPMISAKLMKDEKNGTLSPRTQDALVRLINEQRAKTVASVDAKYQAFMDASKERGLVDLYSSPKVPDIVGSAYVEVVGEQQKQAAILGGGIAATVVGGGALAGATIAVLIGTVGGSSLSFFANYGLIAGGGPIAVAAAAAIAIGVAEVVEITESTKNYDRYVAYKAANQPLSSLQGLDMNNPDNAMQLITSISALTTESLGKLQ